MISSTKIRYPFYAGRGGGLTDINKIFRKESFLQQLYEQIAFLVSCGTKCRCLLGWNTCSTKRHMEGSEDCTDESQRCCDSRVGPEKHRWVTVQLQLRASQQKCSTIQTVVEEIGRDEPHRILVNENQRLRKTMNLTGCAAVQRTSRLHACTCLACGTLAGFLLKIGCFY